MSFRFTLFSILTLIGGLAVAAPTILTESVGQAGDHVITSREVQISAIIEHILEPAKNETGLYELKITDAKFATEVTALLLETMVSLESESFNVGQISDTELKQAIEKVEKATRNSPVWGALEVSPVQLRKLTNQKLVAKNFIKFKTDSMSSIITDSEAQSYHEKNKGKFGELPFASFKENIKNFLAQQQLQDRLRVWFEVLKRKYKVRNFLVENRGK